MLQFRSIILHFIYTLRKLPSSEFKNKLVLRLLAEPWITDIHTYPRDGSGPDTTLRTICIDAVEPYLASDTSISYKGGGNPENFSFHPWRLKLAAKFRAALEAKGELPKSAPESESSLPPATAPTTAPPVSSVPAEVRTKPQTISDPRPPAKSWSWLWIPGLLATAFITALLIKCRKSREN